MSFIRGEQFTIGHRGGNPNHRRALEIKETVDGMRAAVLALDGQKPDLARAANKVTLLDQPVCLDKMDAILEVRADKTEFMEARTPQGRFSFERVPSGDEHYRFESNGEKLEVTARNGVLTVTPYTQQPD